MKAFFKVVNIIGNIIILNVIFILTSILTLGLGVGTSLSALFATYLDLKTDDSGYYIRNYFKHFKENLKYTLIVDGVLILLSIASYLNFLMINTITNKTIKLILFAFLFLIILEISIVSSFIFPVISKFEGSLSHILYLSFIFAHKYLYISILFIILFVLSLYLIIYVSFAFIFIIFGLVFYIESKILKYIWRNYQYEVLEL